MSGNSSLWRARVYHEARGILTTQLPPSYFWDWDSCHWQGFEVESKQGFLQLGSESMWQTSSFKEQVPSQGLCPTAWSPQ